jgi:lysine-specific demethylase 8
MTSPGLRYRYNALWALEHVVGTVAKTEGLTRRRNRVHDRIVESLLRKDLAPPPKEPDRVRDITPKEFHRRYLVPGIPAILEGFAKDTVACKQWSPEYFASEFGDYPLIVSTDDHQDRGGSVAEMRMADYVAAIANGDLRYARVQKILHDHPALLEDLGLERLMPFKRRIDKLVAAQFFFGPRSTETVLHCAFINNLFVQVYGEKEWVIFPPAYTSVFKPPLDRAPTFRSDEEFAVPVISPDTVFGRMQAYRFRLRAGDVLFNPSFHWHHVWNHSATISVSLRVWSLPSTLRASPMLSMITALATNPPALAGVFMMRKGGNFQNFYTNKS